jgi:hypothetical protein
MATSTPVTDNVKTSVPKGQTFGVSHDGDRRQQDYGKEPNNDKGKPGQVGKVTKPARAKDEKCGSGPDGQSERPFTAHRINHIRPPSRQGLQRTLLRRRQFLVREPLRLGHCQHGFSPRARDKLS